MKILFDANLSPALVTGLAAEYPGSSHVRAVSLRSATDAQIWDYAKAHGFVIASKDTDFRERSFVEGFPPKVIWLDVGNAGTAPIEALLRSEQQRVTFAASTDASLLILSIGARASRTEHLTLGTPGTVRTTGTYWSVNHPRVAGGILQQRFHLQQLHHRQAAREGAVAFQ